MGVQQFQHLLAVCMISVVGRLYWNVNQGSEAGDGSLYI
jgi:hypothetical protein